MTRRPRAQELLPIVALAAGLALPQTAQGAVVASFSYSPPSPLSGETVTFTSEASGGTITSEAWDLDNDNFCDDADGPTIQTSFPIAGEYPVTLCVNGGLTSQTQTVTVRNRHPVASFVQSPLSPAAGEDVTFTSTASDADGPIVSRAWDLGGEGSFGDGGAGAVSRSFPRAGSYRIGLRVVDRDGAAATSFRTVRVGASRRGGGAGLFDFLNPFPVVRMVSALTENGVRVRLLSVRAPRGVQVILRCAGRDCPYRRKSLRMEGNGIRFRSLRRFLRSRVVIKVFVIDEERVGKYTRFRIRRNRRPARVDRCLAPGSKRPRRCSAFSNTG